MFMNAQSIKDLILSLTQDIEFNYNNVNGSIIPLSHDDISMSYGDTNKSYNDVDILLKDPFFNGKSLNEIAREIEII